MSNLPDNPSQTQDVVKGTDLEKGDCILLGGEHVYVVEKCECTAKQKESSEPYRIDFRAVTGVSKTLQSTMTKWSDSTFVRIKKSEVAGVYEQNKIRKRQGEPQVQTGMVTTQNVAQTQSNVTHGTQESTPENSGNAALDKAIAAKSTSGLKLPKK